MTVGASFRALIRRRMPGSSPHSVARRLALRELKTGVFEGLPQTMGLEHRGSEAPLLEVADDRFADSLRAI
jgi:hypothetical protein